MHRKTSRLISLLLILILTLSLGVTLTGCGNKETASQQTQASVEEASDQAGKTTEVKKDSADKKNETASGEEGDDAKAGSGDAHDAKDSGNAKDSGKASTSSKSSKASKSSKSSGKESGNKSGNKSGSKSDSSKSSGNKPAQPQVQTASITVDGYCSGKTVTLAEGDTVYDVLKKSGASLKTEKSVYGIYVVGINGLCEGDRGKASGWTYTLNGEMVMKSADKVTVSNGAVVKWTFVTNGL